MTTAPKGRADFYAPGDWNAVCYRCGRKFKASTLIREWQGFYVCTTCHEPRHPQDFVRGIADNPTPPWVQPQPENSFVTVCSIPGISCKVDLAVVTCCIVGYVPPSLDEFL